MNSFSQRWFLRVSALLIVLFGVIGCATATLSPSPIPITTLDISGSGTVMSVLETLQPTFESDLPQYRLNLLTGSGTSGGVQGVLDGSLDLAAMARNPNEEESANGIHHIPFGDAAVAIIVHPSNPVQALSAEQVAGIFAGEITNWSEVGGTTEAIVIFVRDEDESATIALRDVIFQDTPFPADHSTIMTSAGDMITAIEGTPTGIGFGNWPGIRAQQGKVAAIAIENHLPNQAGYPVLTPLGLGFLEARRAEVQPLLDWFNSDSGRTALQSLDILLPTP